MSTPTDPPETPNSARSGPDLSLARARQAPGNQKLPRRELVLHAAADAVVVLDAVAAGQHVHPDDVARVSGALRLAVSQLFAPKTRKGSRLPRPGDATRAGRDVDEDRMAEATAALDELVGRRLRS